MKLFRIRSENRVAHFPVDVRIVDLLDVFDLHESLEAEWVEITVPHEGDEALPKKLAAMLLKHGEIPIEDAAALLGACRLNIYGAYRHAADRHIPKKFRLIVDRKKLKLVPRHKKVAGKWFCDDELEEAKVRAQQRQHRLWRVVHRNDDKTGLLYVGREIPKHNQREAAAKREIWVPLETGGVS